MKISRLPSRAEVNRIFGVVGTCAKSVETLAFNAHKIDMAKTNNRVTRQKAFAIKIRSKTLTVPSLFSL